MVTLILEAHCEYLGFWTRVAIGSEYRVASKEHQLLTYTYYKDSIVLNAKLGTP